MNISTKPIRTNASETKIGSENIPVNIFRFSIEGFENNEPPTIRKIPKIKLDLLIFDLFFILF